MDHERPADPRRALVRPRAAERAGLRLAAALLAAVAVAAGSVTLTVLVRREFAPLVRLDTTLTASVETAVGGSGLLLGLARAVTLLGDPWLVTVLAALLAGWLALRGSTRLALYVVVARVGATLLSTVLKAAVDRVRPVFDEPVAVALGGSFPSGHALGSAAFYVTAAVVLRPRFVRRGDRVAAVAVLAAAVVVPVAVAASRVLLGVHYLSDVIGGVLLGVGWAALCTIVFAAWRVDEGGVLAPAVSAEPADEAAEPAPQQGAR